MIFFPECTPLVQPGPGTCSQLLAQTSGISVIASGLGVQSFWVLGVIVTEASGCLGRHHLLSPGPLGQHSFFTELESVPPQAFGYALGSGSKDSLLSDNK